MTELGRKIRPDTPVGIVIPGDEMDCIVYRYKRTNHYKISLVFDRIAASCMFRSRFCRFVCDIDSSGMCLLITSGRTTSDANVSEDRVTVYTLTVTEAI